MVRIFKTIDGAIHEIQEPQEGCWIALTNPTATEIFEISEQFGIEVDDLRAPLDEEERSRIEVEDNYTLILADVPAIEERNEKDWYVTIPLGIIVTQKMIFTVCLEDTQVLTRFMEGRVRNFFTYMKTRFILQILYRNASMYLRYLRIIDKKSEQIEEKLHLSTRNQELIRDAFGPFVVMLSNYFLSVPAHIYCNAVTGTGRTRTAFVFELITIVLYLLYLFLIVVRFDAPLVIYWTAELLYVFVLFVLSYWYMKVRYFKRYLPLA